MTSTPPPMSPREASARAKADLKAAKAHAKAMRPWYKRPSRVVPLALAVLFVGGAMSGGTETETAAPADASQSQSAPASAKAAPARHGIGDKVDAGDLAFTVTDVKRDVATVGSEFLSETAQGAYTLVTMTVENVSDAPKTFDDSTIDGIDSKGRELGTDSTASLYANENNESFLTEINPGNSLKVTVVFDVAKGETLDQVLVTGSLFSQGVPVDLK